MNIMQVNEQNKFSSASICPLTVQIRKLSLESEFKQTYPLVLSISPELTEIAFAKRQKELLAEGYQCFGVFIDGDRLIAMCGFWIRHRFCYGKALHIDNIVTIKEMRDRGIASLLMQRIVEEAKINECEVVALDAYINNKQAQQFYLKNNMQIAGLHFTHNL
jgi:ribosomal protein S18 acetylase RimI-like enzyme